MGYDPEELTARGATKFSETGGRHTKPLPYLDVAGNQLAVVTAEKKRQAAAAERDRLEMECTEMLKRLKTQHAANEALRKTNELTRRYIQALRAIVCMPQMGGNDKPGQRNALPE
ncbi:MAG: hypothetical protein LBB25_00785 [Holosporaceae bacterium]|nr:hypothetical protein [Holosporaceae bacterium]